MPNKAVKAKYPPEDSARIKADRTRKTPISAIVSRLSVRPRMRRLNFDGLR